MSIDYSSDKYRSKLKGIKKNVENSFKFYKHNTQIFNDFRRYVYQDQLDKRLRSYLENLGMPQMQFNMLFAYISRQLGEFSKQEPGIYVHSAYGQPVDEQTIDVLQNHIKHKLDEAKSDNVVYSAYEYLLSGGYGVFKLWTEYSSPMSFDQEIKFGLPYNIDLCGFDPLAQKPHKGDGRYCWEAFPKTKEEFKKENPKTNIDDLDFKRDDFEGRFSWTYASDADEEIIMVVDYYEKKTRKAKIVKIADNVVTGQGKVMTVDKYEEFIKKWKEIGLPQQPPVIVGEPRETDIETICRYRLISDQIIEYVETDYPILPLIFYGNARRVRNTESGKVEEFVAPYGYYAQGIQDLKNYAGNTLANEFKRMIQHVFVVAEESLPRNDQYLRAYEDIQHANTLVYSAFYDKNPDKQLPPPSVVQRQMTPPFVSETFSGCDALTQGIMGSYDASLGITDQDLSGRAIVEGATQNNATAMPFVVCIMQGLQRVFDALVKMFPKYYVGNRLIPVVDSEGKRNYAKIGQGGINLDYDSDSLMVRVEPGVNYEIQRRANMTVLMQASQQIPIFGQFLNTECLDVIVENLPVKGMDKMQNRVQQFMQQLKQQQAMQAQQAQQGQMSNPLILREKNKQIELAQKAKQNDVQNTIDAAKLALAHNQQQMDAIEMAGKVQNDAQYVQMEREKAHLSHVKDVVDMAVNVADHHRVHDRDDEDQIHRHDLESAELHHKVASTMLKHQTHEASESPVEEINEHM